MVNYFAIQEIDLFVVSCSKHIGQIEISSFEEIQSNMNIHKCAICHEDDSNHSTICNHKFHQSCLNQWIEHCKSVSVTPTCPLCRENLVQEQSANNSEIYIPIQDSVYNERNFYRDFRPSQSQQRSISNMLGYPEHSESSNITIGIGYLEPREFSNVVLGYLPQRTIITNQ